jgi:indole-3-glycerol phosphate synthase
MAPDLLGAIVAGARRSLACREAREPLASVERRAAIRTPRAAAFRAALAARGTNVIAECKRRSPARGVLCSRYDPAAIARAYERAGAAAISVLTEPSFFDGSNDHLSAVRAAVELPILRKDFIVDRYQLVEARALGADAVLLIVRALEPDQLKALHAEARALDLAVLTEVHEWTEIPRALEAGADIVGVNSRDLRTLAVAQDRLLSIAEHIPAGVVTVAESGIRSGADLVRLGNAGYDAFLVGEALVSRADPGQALDELLAAARTAGGGQECA